MTTPAEDKARIAELRAKLLARQDKAGYKVNCAHIRAEIARLETQQNGQADRSGS
jgi:hypothetical protein